MVYDHDDSLSGFATGDVVVCYLCFHTAFIPTPRAAFSKQEVGERRGKGGRVRERGWRFRGRD